MYNLIIILDVVLKKRGKIIRKDLFLVKMYFIKDLNDFKEFWENMKWKIKIYVVNFKYCNVIIFLLYFFFGY